MKQMKRKTDIRKSILQSPDEEGRFHQVKRMFRAVGKVIYLRSSVWNIDIGSVFKTRTI